MVKAAILYSSLAVFKNFNILFVCELGEVVYLNEHGLRNKDDTIHISIRK